MSLLADDAAALHDAQAGVRSRGLVQTIEPRSKIYDEDQLTMGDGISNLRHKGQSQPALGTIGFYARVNGSLRCELVLVSNRHVLLAAGGLAGDPLYRCNKKLHGALAVTRDLEHIANVFGRGGEENYSYAYPGEDAADYFVDCAAARIVRPESLSPRAIWICRPARFHPLDVTGRRSCRVRKTGNATGLTEGRVVDAAATVRSGGISRARNLVIHGVGERFAEPGDSGALIVNDRDEAVGLLWGRDDNNPEIAYGCHIHPVLDRLGVTMLTRGMQ